MLCSSIALLLELVLVLSVVTAPSPSPRLTTSGLENTYDSTAEALFLAMAFAGLLLVEPEPDQPGGFRERSVLVEHEERRLSVGSQALINGLFEAVIVNPRTRRYDFRLIMETSGLW